MKIGNSRVSLIMSILVSLILVTLLITACTNQTATTPPTTDSTTSPTTTPSQEPIELSLSNHTGPSGIDGQALTWWADEVNKRTNGVVTVKIYWSETLAKSREVPEAVRNGTIDMGIASWSLVGIAPLEAIANDALGAFWGKPLAAWMAHLQLYKEYPEVNEPYEAANMKRVTYFGVGNYQLLGKKKIATLGDFKGKKIRASGGTATMVKAVGGTVVGMSSAEAYDALDKGLLDATTGSVSLILSLKQYEVAKQLVLYNFWANPSAGIMMNLDVWNSLSPDVQKVFMDLVEEYAQHFAQLSMDATETGLREFTSQYGVEITEASADVIDEWSSLPEVKNLSESSIARMVEQSGLPEAKIRELCTRYMELLEENAKLYPQEF